MGSSMYGHADLHQSIAASRCPTGIPDLSFKTIFSIALPIYGSCRNVHLSFMGNKSALVHQHLLQHEAYLQKGSTGLVNAAHISRHGLATWRMIPICRRAWSTLRHHFRGKNTSISSCHGSRFDPCPLNTRCGSHVLSCSSWSSCATYGDDIASTSLSHTHESKYWTSPMVMPRTLSQWHATGMGRHPADRPGTKVALACLGCDQVCHTMTRSWV
eukprot:Em0006g35a